LFVGIWEGGFLSTLGSFVLLMMLMTTRGTQGKANDTRFMYLMGFSLCTGKFESYLTNYEVSLLLNDSLYEFECFLILKIFVGLSSGNLIESVWNLDPTIVISALLYTCVIFTCFTLSALIAPEGK